MKLLSAKQFAALTHTNIGAVWDMLQRGRIPEAQKVAGRWVIPEDAVILDIGTEEDPKVGELAKHFSEKPTLDWSVELPPDPERKWKNDHPTGDTRRIKVPGYGRIFNSLGISKREVYRRTKVMIITQNKLLRGERVHPNVVLRLSQGLEIPPEEFLKRG